jgi:hypothetical protein
VQPGQYPHNCQIFTPEELNTMARLMPNWILSMAATRPFSQACVVLRPKDQDVALAPLPVDDRQEFEPPVSRIRAARGAMTGVLLGTGLWGAILALAGTIRA